jgi:hypothetical protein
MRKLISKIKARFKSKKKRDEEFDDEFNRASISGVNWLAKNWFQILEWLALMGALEYLREQTGHAAIYVFLGISALALILYVQIPINIYLERILKKRLPWLLQKFLALMITTAICTILFVMMRSVVMDFASLNLNIELQHD